MINLISSIKRRIKILGDTGKFDFVITEIGGTVGDIESLPYIDAVRQIKWEMQSSAIYIHLTLIPYLSAAGELKTKPTQHSVKTLLESGIQPDILVCRTEHPLTENIKQKIENESKRLEIYVASKPTDKMMMSMAKNFI